MILSLRRFKRRSQGQQMTETVAVLFIFFVLVGFGLIFYFKWHEGSLKEDQQQARAALAMDTTLRVLFLPELMCTHGDSTPEDNCVDMTKVRMLLGVDRTGQPPPGGGLLFFKTHEDYYYDVFGISQIVLHDLSNVLPDGSGEVSFVLYKKEFSGKSGKDVVYEPTYFVVALRDFDSDTRRETYGFGYLEVGVYGEVTS